MSQLQIYFDDLNPLVLTQLQTILRGIPGKSAYQVAVDNGFVGTEAQWLASLGAPQVFPTYASLQAAITAGQFSAPRSVVVTTDETNDNTRTFYNWDGAALQWVPTVGT